MFVLGVLLILGSAALGVGLVYNGGAATSVEILGTTVDTTAAGIFFSGAATMLLFLLGVWLLTSKMGRSRRKRGERKASRRQQRESVAQLEAERAKLAAENERLSQRLDHQQGATSSTDDAPAQGDTGAGGAPTRTDGDPRPADGASSESADVKRA